MSTHHASPLPDENTPSVEIYQQFRGLIVSGQLGGGERLPSVRQVAKDLDVALGTAAKAYKMLERDGLVVSRTGAGTRVAETAAVLPANVVAAIRALVELARHENLKPEDVISALRGAWSADR
jgi:DNA-binding transcriptional regulator YhcF (GntR family)